MSQRANGENTTIHRRGRLIFLGVLLLFGLPQWGMAEPRKAPPVSVMLPSDLVTFQPGPGRDIASGYCVICHSAGYIYMQPPHSPEQWEEIVRKMQQAFGCPIPDDQIPPLVAYLVSQNAIQPPSSRRTASPAASKRGEHAESGKVVYETYCRNCHGSRGKGDGPVGKMLVPPAADLTATTKSDADLLHIIQNGKPGTAMPAWKDRLSSDEVTAVLAYIRSLGTAALSP